LPFYDQVLCAKQKSYPDNIIVSKSHAEVELQNLLDHTATCILQLQDDHLILFGKWGFDGSTSNAKYKQTMDSDLADSTMFVTSYVPRFQTGHVMDRKFSQNCFTRAGSQNRWRA